MLDVINNWLAAVFAGEAPKPPLWHFTTNTDFLDHWQPLIAGFLAFVAGFGTVVATMVMARIQIKAARVQADREIAASQDQTAVAQKQIETTIRLDERRVARERFAFQSMLVAAMGRVIAEAKEAREIFSKAHPVEQTGHSAEFSEAFDAFAERTSEGARYARESFSKHAFSELRGACLHHGGLETTELLELESLIDKFASVTTDVEMLDGHDQPKLVRVGYHAGLEDELTDIEAKAYHLRSEAVEAQMMAFAQLSAKLYEDDEDDEDASP